MDQQYQGTDIEVLKEIFELLRITNKYILDKNRTTELATLEEMSTVSVLAVLEQAAMLKSMVPDLVWFDKD